MRNRGFTLLEIMVAVSIVALITTLTWSTFKDTFRTKKAIEAQSGRYRTVRVALDRMSRDISQAFLSQNEDSSQPERRTLFVGKRKFDVDELRFSYFGHQRLYQDANECDTAQVGYFGKRDPDSSAKMNLIRRETRRLQYLKFEDNVGEADILCDDVVRVKLDYWDSRDKQWREEWVTNSADGQPDRLPSRVRVTMTVHDERGKEVPFATEIRIAMQEPLNGRPQENQAAATGAGTTNAGTTGTGTTNTGTTSTGTTSTGTTGPSKSGAATPGSSASPGGKF